MANFTELFYKSLSSKTHNLTSKFQSFAEKSGWESNVFGAVRVNASGFDIPDVIKESVEDAEYGYKGSPPKAAMRKFKPELKQGMSDSANSAALATLSEKGKGFFS